MTEVDPPQPLVTQFARNPAHATNELLSGLVASANAMVELETERADRAEARVDELEKRAKWQRRREWLGVSCGLAALVLQLLR